MTLKKVKSLEIYVHFIFAQGPSAKSRVPNCKKYSALLLLTFYFDQRLGAVYPKSCSKSSFSTFLVLKSFKKFQKSNKFAANLKKKQVMAPHQESWWLKEHCNFQHSGQMHIQHSKFGTQNPSFYFKMTENE